MPKIKHEDIQILLSEEQTILSRERTMHSYMQTGLAFISVSLIILNLLKDGFYFLIAVVFQILGWLLIFESARRYILCRKVIRQIRKKEVEMGYEIGKRY